MSDRPLSLDRIRARLELDRDRITGLRAAAEIMRNHADDADRESLTVEAQRTNLLILLRGQAVDSDQVDEFEELLAGFGLARSQDSTPKDPS